MTNTAFATKPANLLFEGEVLSLAEGDLIIRSITFPEMEEVVEVEARGIHSRMTSTFRFPYFRNIPVVAG
jgi:hypothetical protein